MKTNDHPPEPDAAPHLPSRYDELISECSVLCVMADAMPEHVSDRVKERQRREMGTLRSGNHYLEVQAVAEIFDPAVAGTFGLAPDDVVVTIHCGSRGLGHQIGTEFLKETVVTAHASGIALPDRELACAINSEVGQRYLGSMRAAINCALANREILGHFARRVFAHFFPSGDLRLLFDVSHNTCKSKSMWSQVKPRELLVHRKGATRAFGHGPPEPARDASSRRPARAGRRQHGDGLVHSGGLGDCRAVLATVADRALSRHAALKQWSGRKIIDDLAPEGTLIHNPSTRGVARRL